MRPLHEWPIVVFAKKYSHIFSSCAVMGTITALGYLSHTYHPEAHGKPNDAHAAVVPAEGSLGSHSEPAAPVEGDSPDEAMSATLNADNEIVLDSPQAAEKTGLVFDEVQRCAIEDSVLAYGTIEYDRTRLAQLTSRVPGFVWRVQTQVGAEVQAGDILALVDSNAVGEAKVVLLQALSQFELKSKIVESLDPSVVAANQIRRYQLELREAHMNLYNARQRLVNLGLPLKVEELNELSDEERWDKIRFLGLPSEITHTFDSSVATANLLPLVAPFDGVVIRQEITIGELVDVTQPSLEIADVRKMWISLDVRQEDAIRLALGQDVSFLPDGSPLEVHSQLSWISTQTDEKTRTVEVRAVVDNPLVESPSGGEGAQRLLRQNTFGTGRISVRSKPDTLAVPSPAVQWDGGNYVVFVRKDECRFECRPVQIGTVTDEMTEIQGGLELGETIVTVGSHTLKSEMLRRRMAQGTLNAPSAR